MTPQEQAAEYALANHDKAVRACVEISYMKGHASGFTAGAAHERARAEGLCAALERISDACSNKWARNTARAALSKDKCQRGE